MVGVHIGLDLEDKAGDFAVGRIDARLGVGFFGFDALGRRGIEAERAQQLVDAEMAQRRTEQDRRHVAFEEGLDIEGLETALDQFGGVLEFRQFGGIEEPLRHGLVERNRGRMAFVDLGAGLLLGVGVELACLQLQHALETAAGSGRPVERRWIELQFRGHFVEQGQGVLGLAVHLVDEGDDRDIAQAADLEQLQGLRLDALGGVQHHDGGVGGGERPVGVFREVLVARRIEQVEHQAGVFEGHHR